MDREASKTMTTDVLIIGSGQAGVPLATKLAKSGKQVVLVERGDPGGTCVNTGCTPTKTMISSARAAHVARTGARLGVHAGQVRVDFAAVVRRKDEIVRQWREGVLRRIRDAAPDLTFVPGHARFVGPRAIEVAGQRFEAATVIINVGARPAVSEIAGLESVPWLDNARVMALEALPAHLVVLGGGYIGCELGQMFRRLGAEVTIIDRGQHLLSREDEEVSSALEQVFRDEGIGLELEATVERVARDGDGVAVTLARGRTVRGSHLLVATGRRPNTDDLGCEAAGIRLDGRGFIEVDDHYRSSVPGVHAVGDVIGGPQFTHVSWDDHRILHDLLSGRSQRGRSGRAYPYTVFTDPQVAGVGLAEKAARRQGIPYEVATMPFGQVARAIELDEPAGVLKVLIDPGTERILGAAIVGAEAGELIHVFVALMQAQASARAIVDAQFVHPTFAEGVQSVVMALERYRSG
jgi:pyruvate/2-oxoglutarate dehydrogenase complex dihydrolipoamide dehydrogenase (E3) component